MEDFSDVINVFVLFSKKKKELELKVFCGLKICIRKLWCNYEVN